MINYYLLTKPGIIMGNLITVAAGFLLASRSGFDWVLFLETLCGLALIIASASVFNNYIDRPIDRKMKRTKDRPLASGLIAGRAAILFAICLGIAGAAILALFTNVLAVLAAFVGFFVYVVLYSLWKSHTIYATAIGSIAGAVPPVVGYCAAGSSFDAGALILLSMLILWQMPHFFAIALFHFEDYSKAGIPVLPVMRGVLKTKVHMSLYILGFICAAMMLTWFRYTGYLYLTIALLCGLSWLCLCLRGFYRNDNQLWGRRMFQLSLVVIAAICFAIPFDKI